MIDKLNPLDSLKYRIIGHLKDADCTLQEVVETNSRPQAIAHVKRMLDLGLTITINFNSEDLP